MLKKINCVTKAKFSPTQKGVKLNKNFNASLLSKNKSVNLQKYSFSSKIQPKNGHAAAPVQMQSSLTMRSPLHRNQSALKMNNFQTRAFSHKSISPRSVSSFIPKTSPFLFQRNFAVKKYFTHEHEWVSFDDSSKVATIGLTNFAQESLGDIVYIDFPDLGTNVTRGDTVAAIESVKAASDAYTPVSGVLDEVNTSAKEDPSLVNSDPEGSGWLAKVKLSDEAELKDLLDEDGYQVVLAKAQE